MWVSRKEMKAISVVNKGSFDLESHVQSWKHNKNVRGENSSEKLTIYIIKRNTDLDDDICAAESFSYSDASWQPHSVDCTRVLLTLERYVQIQI